MAKKSISDVVLRAVVDTSGVAAGLNNIGAQVAGRQFGTGGGGPTGASGAAGGFVNPHGGSAPGSVAATAAAAAFGAGLAGARAQRAGSPVQANESLRARIAREVSRYGRVGSRTGRERVLPMQEMLRLNAAGDPRGLEARFELAREQGNIRRQMLAENSKLRYMRLNRMTGGAYGALRGIGQGIGGMNTRFGSMLGLGRFAPLGGPAMLAAGGFMVGNRIQQEMSDLPGQFKDISRFDFGPDRAAASQISRYLNPPGKKAPLSIWDRYLIESRKLNNGQPSWVERSSRMTTDNKQYFATRLAEATTSVSGALGFLRDYYFPPTMLYHMFQRLGVQMNY